MAINKRKILESAQKHLQKGALDRALKDYQQLVDANPRDANSRLKIGDIQLRRGKRDEAIAAYLKVAEQFMQEGFDAKAVAIYKQVAKIDPKRYEVQIPLAELYQRLGLTAEAMNALQTAADVYNREGRKREALELLRKMATLDPSNTTSRLKIADLLRQSELPEEALAEYREVAAELERQGELERVVTVYERILEIDPDATETRVELARARLRSGDAAGARRDLDAALEREPDSIAVHELRLELHRAEGDEAAVHDAEHRLALLYRQHGDLERAREMLQRLPPHLLQAYEEEAAKLPVGEVPDELTPPAPEEESLSGEDRLLAEAAFGGGDDEGGIGFEPDQLVAEARVYARFGKRERAVQTLETVLAQDPDHLATLALLGELLQEAGESVRAAEVLSRAAAVAREQGEQTLLEGLGARLAELDPEAAERVRGGAAPAPVEATSEPPAEPGTDAVGTGEREAAAAEVPSEPDGDLEIEIELESELAEVLGDALADSGSSGERVAGSELRAEVPEPDTEDAASEAAAGAPAGDGPLDEDVELSEILDDALGAADEPWASEVGSRAEGPEEAAAEVPGHGDATPAASADGAGPPPAPSLEDEVRALERMLEGEPEPPGAGPEESGGDTLGATIAGQIAEDLEEAAFYFEQGLHDEAEAVYRRILEAAPGQPQALLRLGEIAALRGEAPPPPDPGPAPEPAAHEASESGEAFELELDEALEGDLELESGPAARDPGEGASAPPEAGSPDRADPVEAAPAPGAAAGLTASSPDGLPLEETAPTAPTLGPEDAEPAGEPEGAPSALAPGDLSASSGLPEQGPGELPPGALAAADALGPESEAPPADEEGSGDADVLGEIPPAPAAEAEAALPGAQDPVPEVPQEATALTPDAHPECSEELCTFDPGRPEEPPETAPAEADALTAGDGDDGGLQLEEEAVPAEEEPVLEVAELEGEEEPADGATAGAEPDEAEVVPEEEGAVAPDVAEPALAFEEEGGGEPLPGHEAAAAAAAAESLDDRFGAIFQEFKRGVSETLGQEDLETRYDLGIAYREMGLYEDALSEFRLAMELPERRLDCLHLMGLCALDLGRAPDASEFLQQALSEADLAAPLRLALLVDLARAFRDSGNRERAEAALRSALEIEPGSVPARELLAELGGEPPVEDAADGEAFESFDDLIADVAAMSDPAGRAVPEGTGASEGGAPEDPPPASPTPAGSGGRRGRRRRKISFG